MASWNRHENSLYKKLAVGKTTIGAQKLKGFWKTLTVKVFHGRVFFFLGCDMYFINNFLIPFIEILGIAVLIGILLSIVLSVVIFGDRESLEKEKNEKQDK